MDKRYTAKATFPELDRSRKGPGRSEIPNAEPVSGTPPDTEAPATYRAQKAAQARTFMGGATQPVRPSRLAAVAAAPSGGAAAGAAAPAAERSATTAGPAARCAEPAGGGKRRRKGVAARARARGASAASGPACAGTTSGGRRRGARTLSAGIDGGPVERQVCGVPEKRLAVDEVGSGAGCGGVRAPWRAPPRAAAAVLPAAHAGAAGAGAVAPADANGAAGSDDLHRPEAAISATSPCPAADVDPGAHRPGAWQAPVVTPAARSAAAEGP